MHRSFVAFAALVSPALLAPAAAQAPAQARGKSVLVSWSEDRAAKNIGDTRMRYVRSFHTLVVYVSTAGRVFNRYSAGVRTFTGYRTGANEQVAGSAGGGRSAHFEGRTLLIQNAMPGGGGRRISISFDDKFSSCTASVINGLAPGETKSVRRSVITHSLYELYSSKPGDVTCETQIGNAFGSAE
jgi:hypothetical protein